MNATRVTDKMLGLFLTVVTISVLFSMAKLSGFSVSGFAGTESANSGFGIIAVFALLAMGAIAYWSYKAQN
ncbi:MAG: hypothetical protein ABIG20_04195 [archaeon]